MTAGDPVDPPDGLPSVVVTAFERLIDELGRGEPGLIDELLKRSPGWAPHRRQLEEYLADFKGAARLAAGAGRPQAGRTEPFVGGPAPQHAGGAGPVVFTRGTLVGPYKIEEEIGRGTYGVVYKAVQAVPDRGGAEGRQGLNRAVALKVPLGRSPRFQREAKYLMSLDHPRIVKFRDLIEHNQDHILVLEYVDGGSLQDEVRESPGAAWDTRRAAEATWQVAEAVGHAHQQGLIHRDLKPGNVLKTKGGLYKLSDLGLAAAGDEPPLTDGAFIGTRQYAAPETVDPPYPRATPASDVYSLGVILFLLLTGQRPERAGECPRGKAPDVPETLAFICRKCLQRLPGRRYDTAVGLARDLRLFLDGKGLESRPPTAIEALTDWCRANPWRAAAAIISAVSVLGMALAAPYLWWLYGAKHREERRAAVNFTRAMEAIDRTLRPYESKQLARTPQAEDDRFKVLGEMLRLLGELEEANPGEPAARLEAAKVRNRRGVVHRLLGQAGSARADYEAAQGLVAGMGGTEALFIRASADHGLALLHEAAGRPEAGEHLGRALAGLGSLVEDAPGVPAYRYALAACWNTSGNRHLQAGRLEEAKQAYDVSARHGKRLPGGHPDEPDHLALLALSYNNLGALHYQRFDAGRRDPAKAGGAFDKADEAFSESRRLREALAKAQSGSPARRADLAQARLNHGALYQRAAGADRARRAKARELTEGALLAYRGLADEYPRNVGYAVSLGRAAMNLGSSIRDAESEAEKRAEALPHFKLAIKHLADVLERDKAHAEARQVLGSAYWGRGSALIMLKRYAEARQDLDKALGLTEHPTRRLELRVERGIARAKLGEHREAADDVKDVRGRSGVKDARGRHEVDDMVLYSLALVHALCAEAARKDERATAPERERLAGEHLRASLDTLETIERARPLFRDGDQIKYLLKDPELARVISQPVAAELRLRLEGRLKP